MKPIGDRVEELRESMAALKDPHTDREQLRRHWADVLDGKSEPDGGCRDGVRMCDHGFLSWRDSNGLMWASFCECGRVFSRQVVR